MAESVLSPTPEYLGGSLKNFEDKAVSFEAPSLIPTVLNVALSLGFVLTLVYLVYWLLRRWRSKQGVASPGTQQGLIRVLEKNYVDNRHGMAVVEMGDELYFVGLGDEVTLLARITDPSAIEKIKSTVPEPGGFLGFQEHLERVGIHLRRDQWQKNKQDIKAQTAQLDEQIGRLRPGKKRESE